MSLDSTAPKKIEVKISLPPNLLEQSRVMARADGFNEAEFHRQLWVLGLQAYAERSNKLLVNEQLRRKLASEDE